VFGWGLHHYPKAAGAIAVLLVVVVVFAGLSFRHFFPHCRVGLKWGCTNYSTQSYVKLM
jgi:hypothetical protein